MSDVVIKENIFIEELVNEGEQAGLEFLVAGIADQNSAYKQSLLSIAIRHNCQTAIAALLDGYGIDINGYDQQGMLPIFIAAKCGLDKLLIKLVEKYGADLTLRGGKGWNVLCWAVKFNQVYVVATLINKYNMAVDYAIDFVVNINCPIVIAMNNGFTEILEMLINKDKTVIEKKYTVKERGILFFAMQSGHQKIVKLLLDNYLSYDKLNVTDILGDTPLTEAIANFPPYFVATLVEQYRADIYQKNLFGQPPIFKLVREKRGKACRSNFQIVQRNNHVAILKYFVKNYKIDVNATDNMGRSLLFYMVKNKHLKLLLTLYTNSDSPLLNLADLHGQTPLDIARKQGINLFTKIVKKFKISQRVEPIFSSVAYKKHYVQAMLLTVIIGGDPYKFKVLLNKYGNEIDLEYEYKKGKTPVFFAVKRGIFAVVKKLIECNVIINKKYDNNETLAHIAVQSGHRKVLDLLLGTLQVAIDAKNHCFQSSLLFYAIEYNYPSIVDTLLRNYGFSADLKNKDGVLATDFAMQLGMKKILTMLLQVRFLAKGYINSLHFAAMSHYLCALDILLNLYNMSFNSDDKNIIADIVRNGFCRVLEMFMKKHSSRILTEKYTAGKLSIMFLAASSKNPDIISLLVDKYKQNVNERDHCLRTPLFQAIRLGNFDVAKRLLKHNADIKIKNNFGQTAIFEMVVHSYVREPRQVGQIKILNLLLENNQVDINFLDNNCKSLLFHGVTNNHLQIVKILQDYKNKCYDYWIGCESTKTNLQW